MTILEKARKSILCDEISQVSTQENIDSKTLLGLVAQGVVVVPKNKSENLRLLGSVKVNALR